MVFQTLTDIRLHVTAGTYLQMNAICFEKLDQLWIFNAADAMSNPAGCQFAQRFPDADGAAALSRVCSQEYFTLAGVIVGRPVRRQRESGFIPGDVQGGHSGTTKSFHKLRCFQALFAREMPQGAENDSRLDPGLLNASLYRIVHGLNDLLR